jgi:hypothetical protein
MIFATLIAFAQIFCWNGQYLETPTTASITIEAQGDAVLFTCNGVERTFTNPYQSIATNARAVKVQSFEYTRQVDEFTRESFVYWVEDGKITFVDFLLITNNKVVQNVFYRQ